MPQAGNLGPDGRPTSPGGDKSSKIIQSSSADLSHIPRQQLEDVRLGRQEHNKMKALLAVYGILSEFTANEVKDAVVAQNFGDKDRGLRGRSTLHLNSAVDKPKMPTGRWRLHQV